MESWPYFHISEIAKPYRTNICEQGRHENETQAHKNEMNATFYNPWFGAKGHVPGICSSNESNRKTKQPQMQKTIFW